MTIGIIGAGICGLMAARELTKIGHRVWILEKARGLGGRMATRRIEIENEIAVFDHGAQFFTCRSPQFLHLLAQMQNGNVAREWFRGYPSNHIKKEETYPRFCGVRGMTDVPKYLAQDLIIHFNATVRRIDWHNDQWRVSTGNTFSADALILTPPVPQSLAFFTGSYQLPAIAKRALERITYEPCWAVLAQLEGPSKIHFPGALHLEDETISWIADNYQKGISPLPGSVTIHASGEQARYLFDQNTKTISSFLLKPARHYLGAAIISAQAHYWRYAKPLVTHSKPYLVLRKPAPLLFAGDAFLSPGAGPRVEGAALSGLAAARALGEIAT